MHTEKTCKFTLTSPWFLYFAYREPGFLRICCCLYRLLRPTVGLLARSTGGTLLLHRPCTRSNKTSAQPPQHTECHGMVLKVEGLAGQEPKPGFSLRKHTIIFGFMLLFNPVLAYRQYQNEAEHQDRKWLSEVHYSIISGFLQRHYSLLL